MGMNPKSRKQSTVRGRRAKSGPKNSKRKRLLSNKRRGGALPGSGHKNAIIRLIRDPCRAPVIQGVYGSSEGLTARLKNSHVTTGSGTGTAGAVFWIPSYQNTSFISWNMIRYEMADGVQDMRNNTTSPAGAGAVFSTNGLGLSDPAGVFASDNLVRDMRTLAACLQITYTGKVTESAGQIAWVQNLALDDLLKDGVSVNQHFDRAEKTARFGLDTYEVKFRPDTDTGTARFREGVTDPCVITGVPMTNISVPSESADQLSPKVIGFVWRGCEPGVLDRLIITTSKVVEWRPKTESGLSAPPQVDYGLPTTSNICAELDAMQPGWAAGIMQGSYAVASRALTGAWEGLQTQEGKALAGIGTLYLKNR